MAKHFFRHTGAGSVRRWVVAAVCCGTLSSSAAAQQQRQSVRDEIRQAEAEIKRIDKLVGATREEQGETLTHLKLVGTKLENRQRIVQGIESEIGTVQGELRAKSVEVDRLLARRDELKHTYSALIRIAYKNYRNNSFLSFILSSRDFMDAARRVYYVKRIGAEVERRAAELQELRRRLNGEMTELDDRKRELAGLQEEQAVETKHLEEERVQLRKTQEELKGREKELLAEAEKRRRQIAELERQLQQAVNDEVRRSKSSAGKGGGQQAVAQGQLTEQFAARRGKLLRPVEGVVVDAYGVHNHPTQQGVKVNNKGINLAARAGSEVQCVFAGEVRKVFVFPGLGMSVMVRHGAYLTIYANLESVFVREGEQVLEGTPIGTVARAASGQQPTLHFELWRESDNLNPEQWIRR